MNELLDLLSEQLTKDDVELRIGQTSPKGFSLLLYKTARTDIKRLNDTGATWQNKHEYDSMGLLTCTISIYDAKNGIWVDRVDVGTESQTEKQKGLYSDSFKRAGFRWGIGLELYNAPFIWINWEMQKQDNGRYKPVNFYASSLVIDKYVVVNGQFAELSISYNGKNIFEFSQKIVQFKTYTNATGKDMNTYKKQFASLCAKYLLEINEINDFLEFEHGRVLKPNETHNEIVKYLKGGEVQLADQIEMYMNYKRKQSA